jgi:hypothetical protein
LLGYNPKLILEVEYQKYVFSPLWHIGKFTLFIKSRKSAIARASGHMVDGAKEGFAGRESTKGMSRVTEEFEVETRRKSDALLCWL